MLRRRDEYRCSIRRDAQDALYQLFFLYLSPFFFFPFFSFLPSIISFLLLINSSFLPSFFNFFLISPLHPSHPFLPSFFIYTLSSSLVSSFINLLTLLPISLSLPSFPSLRPPPPSPLPQPLQWCVFLPALRRAASLGLNYPRLGLPAS